MGPATRDKVQPLEVTTTSDVTPQGERRVKGRAVACVFAYNARGN
jgi:hypothetical protein